MKKLRIEISERYDGVPEVIGVAAIRIERGGPMWLRYDTLSEEGRNEWDAFEEVLTNLSRNRSLYISGHFDGRGVSGKRRNHRAYSGVMPLSDSMELHRVLTENPNEYYGFLVSESPLTDSMVDTLGQKHNIDAESMVDIAFTICPFAFCAIEECIDRDWFALACYRRNLDEVLRLVEGVLRRRNLLE